MFQVSNLSFGHSVIIVCAISLIPSVSNVIHFDGKIFCILEIVSLIDPDNNVKME